jgi:hypothetical protein
MPLDIRAIVTRDSLRGEADRRCQQMRAPRQSMNRNSIEVQLTPEERSLLLRYGYPFEQIEQALKACESSGDIEIIPMDPFELERLIGDLCISINDMNGGKLQGELLDLCDRLEAAEKSGEGMLDEL